MQTHITVRANDSVEAKCFAVCAEVRTSIRNPASLGFFCLLPRAAGQRDGEFARHSLASEKPP